MQTIEEESTVLDMLRFHHESFQETTSKDIVVIIFSGGQSGGQFLEKKIREQRIPCFHFHNMDEFYVKYCASLFPKNQKMSLDSVIDVLRKEYQRVLIVDIYRDPISRRIESFFSRMISNLQQYVWALPSAVTLYEKWDHTSFSEKQEIFERVIFHWIEQRDGIDTECRSYFDSLSSNKVGFDFEKHRLFFRHPTKPFVFFLKLRFQDWQEWDTILGYYLQIQSPWLSFPISTCHKTSSNEISKTVNLRRRFESPYCPFQKMKSREQGFFYEFVYYYRPSIMIKTQLFQNETFLRYLTRDEQNYILQYGYSFSLSFENGEIMKKTSVLYDSHDPDVVCGVDEVENDNCNISSSSSSS